MTDHTTDPRTHLQQLGERFYLHLTGQQLAAVAAAARARAVSWRDLAAMIAHHTDGQLELPAETLRRWYRHLDGRPTVTAAGLSSALADAVLGAEDRLEAALAGADAAIDAAAEVGDWAEVARLRQEERQLLAEDGAAAAAIATARA